MRSWLERARELQARLALHEESVQRVSREVLLKQVKQGLLRDGIDTQPLWDQAPADLRWRFDTFRELVERVSRQKERIEETEKRLAFLVDVEKRSLVDHAEEWEEAIDAIAESPHYGGLRIVPQLGLVPLGPDARSELWEFWHVATGEEPELDLKTDSWVITGETAVILVLIPGGTFWMGAQKEDPSGPNYDPEASGGESPVHQVMLSPFFVSKYEMTREQWVRVTGENPGWNVVTRNGIEITFTLSHPVACISWYGCRDNSAKLGLRLPTEVQWEYACRAGTSTSYAGVLGEMAWYEGNSGGCHHPVGQKKPNVWGLYDMHGNVREWCLDLYGDYPSGSVTDPTGSSGGEARVLRGGGWYGSAGDCRSADRGWYDPGDRNDDLGFRPARSVH
ncbi:MAG: formylglycine-generating enzyme family protein [Planctomycetota bacterium]